MTASDFFISLIGMVSGIINQFITYMFQVPAFFYTACIVVGCGLLAVVYRILKGVIM